MSEKVSREVAEAEFDAVLEAVDVLVSDDMSEDEVSSYSKSRDVIVKAIMSGRMSIDDSLRVVLNADGGPIVFNHPRGETFMAMDRRKESEKIGKMVAVMCSLTGKDGPTFSRLKLSDFKLCSALVTLFLS